jgi:hypothetical protein
MIDIYNLKNMHSKSLILAMNVWPELPEVLCQKIPLSCLIVTF